MYLELCSLEHQHCLSLLEYYSINKLLYLQYVSVFSYSNPSMPSFICSYYTYLCTYPSFNEILDSLSFSITVINYYPLYMFWAAHGQHIPPPGNLYNSLIIVDNAVELIAKLELTYIYSTEITACGFKTPPEKNL